MTRTTHRSTAGKKLYAVRAKDGKFKDVQTYKRAHAADLRKTAKAERTILRWMTLPNQDSPVTGYCGAIWTSRANARVWAAGPQHVVRRVRIEVVKAVKARARMKA